MLPVWEDNDEDDGLSRSSRLHQWCHKQGTEGRPLVAQNEGQGQPRVHQPVTHHCQCQYRPFGAILYTWLASLASVASVALQVLVVVGGTVWACTVMFDAEVRLAQHTATTDMTIDADAGTGMGMCVGTPVSSADDGAGAGWPLGISSLYALLFTDPDGIHLAMRYDVMMA